MQSVYFVDKANKSRLLLHLLQDPAIRSALIFTRTKHGADRVVRDLGRAGVQALAIHGNKSQNARQNALGSFKNGSIRVLVATDIAARGIDVEELSHVINYDLPNIPETYVHRIGRTGRAGLSGVAVSFCDFEEKAYLKDIEKLIRKPVPVVEGHPYPMQVFEIPPKPERPPRQNSRPGQGPKADARNAVRPGPHKQAAKQPDSKEENKSRGTGRVQNVPGTVRKKHGGHGFAAVRIRWETAERPQGKKRRRPLPPQRPPRPARRRPARPVAPRAKPPHSARDSNPPLRKNRVPSGLSSPVQPVYSGISCPRTKRNKPGLRWKKLAILTQIYSHEMPPQNQNNECKRKQSTAA